MSDLPEEEMSLLRPERSDEFILKYDGEAHDIDAFTLTRSVMEIATLLQAINQELETGKRIDIRIRALTPDSFDVHVVLQENAIPALISIFTVANLSGPREIVQFFIDLLNLRKLLGGEPPAKVEEKPDGSINIVAQSGAQVNYNDNRVFISYNKPQIANGLDHMFQTLDGDEAIEGFEVQKPDRTRMFEAARSFFRNMISSGENTEKLQEGRQRAWLLLSKPNLLDPSLKWEFVLFGSRITASIKDEDFLRGVEDGTEAFRGSEQMEVDLSYKIIYNPQSRRHEYRDYIITKVYGHQPTPKEQQLPLSAPEE